MPSYYAALIFQQDNYQKKPLALKQLYSKIQPSKTHQNEAKINRGLRMPHAFSQLELVPIRLGKCQASVIIIIKYHLKFIHPAC